MSRFHVTNGENFWYLLRLCTFTGFLIIKLLTDIYTFKSLLNYVQNTSKTTQALKEQDMISFSGQRTGSHNILYQDVLNQAYQCWTIRLIRLIWEHEIFIRSPSSNLHKRNKISDRWSFERKSHKHHKRAPLSALFQNLENAHGAL